MIFLSNLRLALCFNDGVIVQTVRYFLGAIGLAMTGAPISLAFFTGAIAMVLTRTLSIQEAYQAIKWKGVFLLAGLIPLGVAMQKSGTVTFLAEKVMSLVQGGTSGANSFILPTHQVNAFLMCSGGYRNADYFKVGGGMTLLFLVVVVPMFYFFYL